MISECDNCIATVQVQEVGSYTLYNEYDPMDTVRYVLCKCSQCFSPILIQQDLLYNQMEETEWGNPKKIFPGSQFHINPVIPDELQKSLVESIKCYKSDAPTATAIMCRRTIEGFCQLKGVMENNLDKSIKKLRDGGFINEQLYDWANQLRLVGNEAAHNINAVFSEMDARDILDFTIAILDFTYSFKDKFDKFKERHAK
jgi:hypothetical protein